MNMKFNVFYSNKSFFSHLCRYRYICWANNDKLVTISFPCRSVLVNVSATGDSSAVSASPRSPQ